MQRSLIFVIGPPRSGSTLLMRMLSSHSAIYSRAEPHLLTPLAHLGYYDAVEAAPFDHLQAQQSAREFVADLPAGEADYLDACRAYTDVLYGRMLAACGKGKPLFLDKTPANALVLPFIAKLYPRARYVVLTRHPAAIWSSYANSFFDGDYVAARKFNPILNRYVPAMARFIRDQPVPYVRVGYEELVQNPEAEMRRVFGFLEVPFEAGAIDYGKHEHESKGLGDPLGVQQHSRPVTDSVEKWAHELAGDPEKLAIVRDMVGAIPDADLETWGFPRATFFAPVEAAAKAGAKPAPKPPFFDRYRLQRKALVMLRRNIQHNAFGRVVKRIRLVCDVLLRGCRRLSSRLTFGSENRPTATSESAAPRPRRGHSSRRRRWYGSWFPCDSAQRNRGGGRMISRRFHRFVVILAAPIVLVAACARTTDGPGNGPPGTMVAPPPPAAADIEAANKIAANVEAKAKRTEKAEGKQDLVKDHVQVKTGADGGVVVEQTGEGSWYGRYHHGRKTASGGRFNQNALTAAHPTLPLGTKATVTNLENGKSVDVTINDRGPYARGRDIDLSKAAAQRIGVTDGGAAPVRIDAVVTPSPPRPNAK